MTGSCKYYTKTSKQTIFRHNLFGNIYSTLNFLSNGVLYEYFFSFKIFYNFFLSSLVHWSRSADWRIAIRLLANFLFCIIESLFLFPSTFRMLTRIFDALVVNFKQFQALLNHLFVITRESRFSRELDSLQT